jgi:molecular chaperone DnaK (HSP70)
MARYLIGIDLGTTNSALASIDLQQAPRGGGRVPLRPFPVPQLVAPGEARERPLLPSFLYLPGPHDLAAGGAALPWDPQRDSVVGEFARNHGGKVPGRLVTSAKSWLCHPGVDRSAPLLPWSAPPDVPRVSPVEASARYLRHLVEGWNWQVAKDRPDCRLEEQVVVLTVPASFDDVARTLTVEAAAKAGLANVVLLEEPQAAFYCWLATHPPVEATRLHPGARCLVVDVGGGTTDFSLIEAVEDAGELGFVRQAVGDHLLLGGDNMDLALARFVESKLPAAGRLDATQYSLLTQACRQAKEALLGPAPPASQTVTVIGRGRAVIGGTLHAQITPADVRQVIFDGFFPVVPAEAAPARGARAGLHEMGLPYVDDPAVTRHLSAFLRNQSGGAVEPPAAILFNGGVFQPQALRDRLLEVMHGWYDRPGAPWQPLVLTNPSLDLAVALGAAYYGWLRHIGGKRIGGGIPRSYYVAISADGAADEKQAGEEADKESPEPAGPLTVVCVVPMHAEEGQDVLLEKPELELALGQPVVFPLFTSTVRATDKAGDVLRVSPKQLLRLPPLHTVLRGGKRAGTKRVPVTLASRMTAIGTLELFCVAKEGSNRWKLEFNVRGLLKEAPPPEEKETAGLTEVWLETQVQEAGRLIRAAYLGGEPSSSSPVQLTGSVTPQELTRALEGALETSRHEWPMGLCRRLWDFLQEVAEQRRKSPAHLSRWYNLVGHCLRPGFGDPLDRLRVEQLWKMLAAPPRGPGAAATRAVEGGADFWVVWRRVAGGLNGALQQALFDRMRPTLLPAKARNVPRPNPNELAEMWRSVASLERLDVKHKEALGTTLLKAVQRSPVAPYGFWALTRLGARALLYGPMNAVVHPQVVGGWLDAVLPFQPGNEGERQAFAFCLAQLARRTGQRALDVDDGRREGVLAALRGLDAPEHWVKMVEEVSELQAEEQGQMLGDALPIGLRLAVPQG